MILTKHIEDQIKNHCLKDKENESCGVIVLSKTKIEAFPCKNISNVKSTFTIDPEDYLKASCFGKILAAYHSHLTDNCRLSEFDKLNSNNHNLTYIIYNIKHNQFFEYKPNSFINKYIGRPFVIRDSDCFNLIFDYYKNELGVEIQTNEKLNQRKSDWHTHLPNIVDEIKKINTSLEETIELNQHNIIVYKFFELLPPNHYAIYLGNDTILHQKRNKYSTIEQHSKYLKSKIHKIFKLKK